jgi:cellulose biosynthesis protein BcsQ
MRLLALYHVKGGVGKTVTAVNLAFSSARDGARTLLWDLDPQGAASFLLRVRPEVSGAGRRLLAGGVELADAIRGSDHEGLDVLPSDARYRKWSAVLARADGSVLPLRELLAPLAGEYERVFLDCAPGLTPVSELVFDCADGLVLPTVPTPLSLRTLAQLMKHLKHRSRRPRTLPFFSMVDARKTLHRSVCRWAEEQSLGFLRTEIPYSSLVEQMSVKRCPIFALAPSSEVAGAFERLWQEILARLAADEPAELWRRRTREALERLARRDPGPGGAR